MIHTTLNLLKLAGACGQHVGSGEGYDLVRAALGKEWRKDAPIPLTRILDSNGLDDTLWCLQATIEDWETVVRPFVRLLMAGYLEYLALSKLPAKSKELLDEGVTLLRDPAVTEGQLNTYASKAGAARAAATAAGAASWAATSWWAAMWAAAAGAAAGAAASAGAASWAATWVAAMWAATTGAERQWQTQHLLKLLEGYDNASQTGGQP